MKAVQVVPHMQPFRTTSPSNGRHRFPREMPPVGLHIIAELYGVAPERISFVKDVEPVVEDIVREAGLTRLQSYYHQFHPHGVTGIVLLAESHVSLHTWPEHGLVNLDIFTCGDPAQAQKAFQLFLERFQPASYRHLQLERG